VQVESGPKLCLLAEICQGYSACGWVLITQAGAALAKAIFVLLADDFQARRGRSAGAVVPGEQPCLKQGEGCVSCFHQTYGSR